jgi:hypothetical protein
MITKERIVAGAAAAAPPEKLRCRAVHLNFAGSRSMVCLTDRQISDQPWPWVRSLFSRVSYDIERRRDRAHGRLTPVSRRVRRAAHATAPRTRGAGAGRCGAVAYFSGDQDRRRAAAASPLPRGALRWHERLLANAERLPSRPSIRRRRPICNLLLSGTCVVLGSPSTWLGPRASCGPPWESNTLTLLRESTSCPVDQLPAVESCQSFAYVLMQGG